jgi:hypothetical protein
LNSNLFEFKWICLSGLSVEKKKERRKEKKGEQRAQPKTPLPFSLSGLPFPLLYPRGPPLAQVLLSLPRAPSLFSFPWPKFFPEAQQPALPLSLAARPAPHVSSFFPLSSRPPLFPLRRLAAQPLPVAPLCRTPRALAPHSSPRPGQHPTLLPLLEARSRLGEAEPQRPAEGAGAVARTTRTPRPLRPFLDPAALSRSSSAATTSPSFPRALAPPCRRSARGQRRCQPSPAPSQSHPGAANSPPQAVVAASGRGKDRAVPLSPSSPPLRVRVPLAAMTPSRPRRGEHRPEPQSAAPIAQMGYTCCQHPPGLGLVPNGAWTARSAIAGVAPPREPSSGDPHAAPAPLTRAVESKPPDP